MFLLYLHHAYIAALCTVVILCFIMSINKGNKQVHRKKKIKVVVLLERFAGFSPKWFFPFYFPPLELSPFCISGFLQPSFLQKAGLSPP